MQTDNPGAIPVRHSPLSGARAALKEALRLEALRNALRSQAIYNARRGLRK